MSWLFWKQPHDFLDDSQCASDIDKNLFVLCYVDDILEVDYLPLHIP